MLMVMLLWLVSRVDLPLDVDNVDDYRDALQRGDEKILRTARGLVVERAAASWLDVGMVVVGMVVLVALIGVVGVSVGAGEGGW